MAKRSNRLAGRKSTAPREAGHAGAKPGTSGGILAITIFGILAGAAILVGTLFLGFGMIRSLSAIDEPAPPRDGQPDLGQVIPEPRPDEPPDEADQPAPALVEAAESLRLAGVLPGHPGGVLTAAILADPGFAATAGRDGAIRIWNLDDATEARAVQVEGVLTAAAISAGSELLVVGDESGRVRAFRLPDFEPLAARQAHAEAVAVIKVHPDEPTFITIGADNRLKQWNVDDDQPTRTADLADLADPPASAALTPDFTTLAMATGDGQIAIHDGETLEEKRRLDFTDADLAAPAAAIAFGPDGQRLAVGHAAVDGVGRVTIWSLDTGQPVVVFLGHGGDVTAVDFNPTGTMLVSGSGGGEERHEIRLWDAMNGAPLKTFQAQAQPVTALDVGPDGRMISAADDGRILVWTSHDEDAPADPDAVDIEVDATTPAVAREALDEAPDSSPDTPAAP